MYIYIYIYIDICGLMAQLQHSCSPHTRRTSLELSDLHRVQHCHMAAQNLSYVSLPLKLVSLCSVSIHS